MTTPNLTLRIPPELREQLDAYAKSEDRTINKTAVRILQQFFDNQFSTPTPTPPVARQPQPIPDAIKASAEVSKESANDAADGIRIKTADQEGVRDEITNFIRESRNQRGGINNVEDAAKLNAAGYRLKGGSMYNNSLVSQHWKRNVENK